MNLSRLAMTAVGTMALATAMPAQAATAVFDFGTLGTLDTVANPDIYTQTVGGLTLTVRAYGSIFNTVNYNNPINATRSGAGLGAAGNGSDELNHTGDWFAAAPGEGLLFSFSQVVTLGQLAFSEFDGLNDADFAWGDPLLSGTALADILGISGGTWNPIGTYTGKDFFVAARDDWNIDPSEGFRLKGITVNYQGSAAPLPPTAAVPEPTTWALMILGFGVVGASMRRRQRPTVRVNFA